MKLTYLGQAGLLFEKAGFKIMIDPYLSNSVEKFITCDSRITVLALQSVWNEVRKIGGKNNYSLWNVRQP